MIPTTIHGKCGWVDTQSGLAKSCEAKKVTMETLHRRPTMRESPSPFFFSIPPSTSLASDSSFFVDFQSKTNFAAPVPLCREQSLDDKSPLEDDEEEEEASRSPETLHHRNWGIRLLFFRWTVGLPFTSDTSSASSLSPLLLFDSLSDTTYSPQSQNYIPNRGSLNNPSCCLHLFFMPGI